MKFSKGFTLSEILIAMLVLGIIVAASVPVILNLTPNKNAIMIKKAYYATESIIHSLINDPNYYPDMTVNCIKSDGSLELSGRNDCYFGFDYAPNGIHVSGVTNEVTTTRKLQCLFASKLNIKEDLNSVCRQDGIDVVTTMDGMSWHIGGLSNGSTDGTINIDVDGLGKGVHAYNLNKGTKGLCAADTQDSSGKWTGTWGATNCSTASLTARARKNFDRIQITISRDGKLSIEDNQDEFAKIISGETKLIGGDDDEDE